MTLVAGLTRRNTKFLLGSGGETLRRFSPLSKFAYCPTVMHAHSPQPEEKQPTSGISGHGSPDGTTKVFPTDLYDDGYSDPVYRAKARILNNSIQEIGMGKYQVSGERVFRSHHLFE